jgi:threonine dehydrogenase-like Zn-dependent dehydrogenase
MKAAVFHGIGDVRVEEVRDPKIEKPTDAIVRLTASAICGTDLHLMRGTMPGMVPGTILGHEGVGIIEALGKEVRNLMVGDRVVIPSTIACGSCSYCRAGYYAQCDDANPLGKRAGTAFYGGTAQTGPFHGLQAEMARIPFAHVNLVKLPATVSDDQALMLSDIAPTGYFGAELADISEGKTVAVFGCGPVGQFAILSAKLMGAGRVFAVDRVPSRLEAARRQGAEVIDFEKEDPVETLVKLTGGIGVDRAIDAVGVDAEHADKGPASMTRAEKKSSREEVKQVAPGAKPDGEDWAPGNAPSQVLSWAVNALAKAGTLSVIGVYPPTAQTFPIGMAMMKNLTIKMGNCNHRKYIPRLLGLVASGVIHPEEVITRHEGLTDAVSAYKAFDKREEGWMKVELAPGS